VVIDQAVAGVAGGAGVADVAGVAGGERRREELGSFLKARRARLSPEDCGIPRGARRRTPGLRREEVALLAGVGVTWYTWLEQGREINVSTQVLDAVARTHVGDHRERAASPGHDRCPAAGAHPGGRPDTARLPLTRRALSID